MKFSDNKTERQEEIEYENVSDFQVLIDMWTKILKEKKCFWSNQQNIFSVLSCIISELVELEEALWSCDLEEIISEIGDVLGLTLMLCFIAQRDGITSVKSIVHSCCDKIKRRSSYVFEDDSEYVRCAEDAEKQWAEMKKIEQHRKSNQKKHVIHLHHIFPGKKKNFVASCVLTQNIVSQDDLKDILVCLREISDEKNLDMSLAIKKSLYNCDES